MTSTPLTSKNIVFSLLATTAITTAITTAALSPAQAQSGPTVSMEEIVVIGTRAAGRTMLDSPVPVDIVTADQLTSTGAVAGELGQALAAVAPSFNFPRQSNSGTSDLVRAGQLRGLSPDQLLVLVNGKRRHTSAIVNSETKIGRGTAAVDFNTIPLNAVERIEVLRDGAGAQYGSDAIAGVVNVVLDTSPGFQSTVSYGAHVTDVDPINDSVTDGETFTLDAKYGWQLADGGFVKVGGFYRDRNGTNRAGFDTVPFFEAQTPANLALAGQQNYAEGDPEVKEFNLWINSVFELSGDTESYLFGTFGDRESEGGAAFYRYPDSSSNVLSLYPNGFRPQTQGDDRDSSITAGLRGETAGWEIDGSVTYGRNRFIFGVENSLNASLGAASPTEFESGTYEFQQLTANLDITRDFAVDSFASPITLAVGAEFRHEDYNTSQGDEASFAAGAFDGAIGAQAAPGLTPADVANINRDVASVYAEVSADVTDALFIDLAGRFEDYTDFGSSLTGKASARYAITDNFALRGAVSNSFRAPNLAQAGFADTTLNFGTNRALIRTRTLPVTDPIAQSLGAKTLSEEQSFNLSAGFTAQIENFSFAFDAFRIDVDDRVTLSERLFSGALTTAISGLPGAAGVESVRFFTNAVDTRTEGFDIVTSYTTPLADGDLTLSAAFNYANTDIQTIRATTPELTAIDPSLVLVGVEEINTLEDAAPDNKLILTGAWSNDRLDSLVRVSRFGSAVRVFNFGGGFEPRQEYGAEWQVDLEAGYQVTENVKLVVGASNLFDNYPDLSSADINYFGNLPYDILSPVGINGRFVYSRATFSF